MENTCDKGKKFANAEKIGRTTKFMKPCWDLGRLHEYLSTANKSAQVREFLAENILKGATSIPNSRSLSPSDALS